MAELSLKHKLEEIAKLKGSVKNYKLLSKDELWKSFLKDNNFKQ